MHTDDTGFCIVLDLRSTGRALVPVNAPGMRLRCVLNPRCTKKARFVMGRCGLRLMSFEIYQRHLACGEQGRPFMAKPRTPVLAASDPDVVEEGSPVADDGHQSVA